MPKFVFSETIYSTQVRTARGGTIAAKHTKAENGKAVKLAGLENYVLCAAGDAIEGIQGSSNFENQGTVDGYSIIGVYTKDFKNATVEGATVVPGDYVVAGTVLVLGMSLTIPLKVAKAADQVAAKAAPFKARVVGLGTAGTGVAGTTVVIELL